MMKQTRRTGASGWFCAGMLGAVWLANISSPPTARAQEESPSKASCARAYESAQESRAAGQLQETQKRLSVCARPECPSFVQKDCARWFEEVGRELPSVIVEAKGLDAEGARQVTVTIDGNPVPDALGGQAIDLDPGRHELVAESPGRPSISRVIVAQQGVQKRKVSLDFGALEAPAPAATVELDPGTEVSSLRPYAFVAWGVGAVGLGMFAVLGTLGRADEEGLEDDCPEVTLDPALVKPGVCLTERFDERRDIYKREFLLADVGLVTGIVGAATGTVLFLLDATGSPANDSGNEAAAAVHLDVKPTASGGYAIVRGTF